MDDVDLSTRLGKCRGCNSVFELGAQVVTASPAAPLVPPRGYAFETPASGESMYRDDARGKKALVITRRWFRYVALFLLLFCIVWDGFLLTWYVGGLTQGAPFFFQIFPLVHVAVGIGLTYYTASLFLNRSRIELSAEHLNVSHGPLPWPGVKALPLASVRGVKVGPDRRWWMQNRNQAMWAVFVETEAEVKPVVRLLDEDGARFVGTAVARALELPDPA
ncbi:MAG: hypothetical protein H6721_25530 [Sandaracinus sp.]|nr:hypothetical protein [Sandaracinus sp.]